jgi:hypothetical protein
MWESAFREKKVAKQFLSRISPFQDLGKKFNSCGQSYQLFSILISLKMTESSET